MSWLDDLNQLPDRGNVYTFKTPVKKKGGRGGTLTSLISEGGAIGGGATGAGIGTAILPGIGTLLGGAIGAGIGGFTGRVAENKVRDNRLGVGDAAKEGALSAVLGGGPIRLGKAALGTIKAAKGGASLTDALVQAGNKSVDLNLTKVAGNKLSKAGESLIAKEFRLNPTQQANFKKLHGEEAVSILRRYGIQKPEDLVTRIEPLQNAFDATVKNIPAVNGEELRIGLAKVYRPLLESPALFEQQLGKQLKTQADELLKLTGDKIVKTVPEKFDESALRNTLRENVVKGVQSGGKSAKAITRSILTGKSRDAYGITMNAFAQSPNKAEIADLVKKILPQLEGAEKNRLVKNLVDIKDPQKAAERIWETVGSKTSTLKSSIPANKVNELRKTFDAAVQYTQKGAPEHNVIKKTADALRSTLHNAAEKAGVKVSEGQSFKDAGLELQKLYNLNDIVSKQAYLGTGNLPANLPTLLGAAGGAGAAGPLGAIGGVVATKALNSALGRRIAANSTIKAGESMVSRGGARNPYSVRALAGRILPASAGGAILGQTSQPSPNQDATIAAPTTTNPMTNANIGASYQAPSDLSTNTSPFSPQNLQSSIQQILTNGGSLKDATEFLSLAEALQKVQMAGQGSEKPLSAEASKVVSNANIGLQALDDFESAISQDSSVLAKRVVPGRGMLGGVLGNALGTRGADAAAGQIIDVIARLRTGAAITNDEARRFETFIPQAGDPPDVAQQKLNYLRNQFSAVANRGSGAGSDLESALMSAQGAY